MNNLKLYLDLFDPLIPQINNIIKNATSHDFVFFHDKELTNKINPTDLIAQTISELNSKSLAIIYAKIHNTQIKLIFDAKALQTQNRIIMIAIEPIATKKGLVDVIINDLAIYIELMLKLTENCAIWRLYDEKSAKLLYDEFNPSFLEL